MREVAMTRTRRGFLGRAAGAIAGAALRPGVSLAGDATGGIRLGACVVGLEQGREAGLDGVEVPVGGPAERLEISRPEVRARYKESIRQAGIPISSLMM